MSTACKPLLKYCFPTMKKKLSFQESRGNVRSQELFHRKMSIAPIILYYRKKKTPNFIPQNKFFAEQSLF